MYNFYNLELINDVSKALRKTSQTSAHHVIDNSNITTEKLWKDGLHLTNSGKLIVVSNFVHSLW